MYNSEVQQLSARKNNLEIKKKKKTQKIDMLKDLNKIA